MKIEKSKYFLNLFSTLGDSRIFSGSKCINPISALTLCLTSRKYKLSFRLFHCIIKYMPITRDTLKQI